MKSVLKKTRVVLDTNVLISTLGFQGPTQKIWRVVETGEFVLYTSPFILEEFMRVLTEKLDLTQKAADVLLEEIKLHAIVVRPRHKISAISKNDADNRILECAVAAKADVIITGNLKHIKPLGSYQGIKILTPREFLTMYFRES